MVGATVILLGLVLLFKILIGSPSPSSQSPPPTIQCLQIFQYGDGPVRLGDDRTVVVEQISQDPKMLLIHDFLSSDECDALVALAEQTGMSRSTVQGKQNEISKDRTSSTTNLKKAQTDVVRRVEERAQMFSGVPQQNFEPLQVCRYHPSQQYKPHFDYFVPGVVGTKEALMRGGQRQLTFFVYLNDLPADEQSGHTFFPNLDLKIKPRKGMAAVWMNVLPHNGKEDPRMLHAGLPPTTGTKYGLNIWSREREFN